MKLIKNKRAWTKEKKRFADGSGEPDRYPCYLYAVVQSWNYEEEAPEFIYTEDAEKMLRSLELAAENKADRALRMELIEIDGCE